MKPGALPIVIPARVRARHGVPFGPLFLVGTWAMGEDLARRGLWVQSTDSNRAYPITNVEVQVAQSWLDAAQRGSAA